MRREATLLAILERGPSLDGNVLEPLVDLDEAADAESTRVARWRTASSGPRHGAAR